MKAIRNFLRFSFSENKGIWLLSFLFFILLLFRIYMRYSAKEAAVNVPFKITLDNETTVSKDIRDGVEKAEEMEAVSLKTEINKATRADFEAIGVPGYLAERIIKYRMAIGNFKSLEQIKKTYGMNDNLFRKIYPFIYIEEKMVAGSPPENKKETIEKEKRGTIHKVRNKTRINSADSIEIDNTKGISSNFASKILRYRDRLGGFYSANQLADIYYFGHDPDSQYYRLIMENIEVGENEITKININKAGIEILGKHPYIGYPKAKIILAFIKQHGRMNSLEELQKATFIPEANIEKLRHYLVFD